MPTMRPEATGLRMKRTQWAALRSPVNRPRPATSAGSSSRRMARPTHFIPEPAVGAAMGASDQSGWMWNVRGTGANQAS